MTAALTTIKFTMRTLSAVSPRLAGRFALTLFSTPMRKARVRPEEHEALGSAQRETIDVMGHRVATYRWGDGSRPVLLLHGWESRASRWAPFVPELLAKGFSPIAFDAPGHGETTGKFAHLLEYRAIATRLQERYGVFEAVVAHSLGALYVYHALRTGVATRRLAAISGPCHYGYPVETFSAEFRLSPRAEADFRGRIERFFHPERDIWERFSPGYQPGSLDFPILLVHDRKDRVIAYRQAELLAEAYGAGARLITTEGLGHHRIMVAPDVIRHVIEFVTGADQGSR
ncbi:alpha/beta hydrolase [Actinoplanes sp. NPDC049802]|uniref:alpha/beta hydrolase n=1 Tax=Actinoplanes sp. NPDC049802 TaxID=3154742 RepID=UPI0033D63760